MIVAENGAKYLKPVLLELGGKAPVMADSDMDNAVRAAAFGELPSVHEFTEVQWVTIEDPAQHYPI